MALRCGLVSIGVILVVSIVSMGLASSVAEPSAWLVPLLLSLPQWINEPVMLSFFILGPWGCVGLGVLIAYTAFDRSMEFLLSRPTMTITRNVILISFPLTCLIAVLSVRAILQMNKYPSLHPREDVLPILVFFGALPILFLLSTFRRARRNTGRSSKN